MAHKHSVYDTDKHFFIDPDTRAVTKEKDKIVVVQGDHNSERFTFEIPRFVDGHDMSTCNKVEVHYNNVDTANPSEPHPNAYEVDDLGLSPDDESVVILSWLLSSAATQYVGKLHFSIKFMCDDGDGKPDYVWKTATNKSVFVVEAEDSGEVINTECEDMLKTIEERITENVNAGVDDKVDKAVEVDRKRIDEFLAMRTDGGAGEYTFEDDMHDVTVTIITNGAVAKLELVATDILLGKGETYTFTNLPKAFAPMLGVDVKHNFGAGIRVYISTDPDVEFTPISIINTGNGAATINGSFDAEYPVAILYVPEVIDGRVGYDNNGNSTTYPALGAAIRAAQNMATELYRLIAEMQNRVARIAYVYLPASGWQGAESPYYQEVNIAGVTENSQVDLTPNAEQLGIFHNKDVAFVTENEDGVVTVYAIGQKPANDYRIQVTITEVVR